MHQSSSRNKSICGLKQIQVKGTNARAAGVVNGAGSLVQAGGHGSRWIVVQWWKLQPRQMEGNGKKRRAVLVRRISFLYLFSLFDRISVQFEAKLKANRLVWHKPSYTQYNLTDKTDSYKRDMPGLQTMESLSLNYPHHGLLSNMLQPQTDSFKPYIGWLREQV